ncbi:MAG: nuclear transport factor 2 family protein [Acidimicrobiales bacterium]
MPSADTLTELSERLQRLEDMEEIHRLYVDYGRHLDDGDPVAYGSLFARNAKIRMGSVLRADGREDITRAASQMLGNLTAGEEKSSVHLIDTPRIELSGDTASGECVWAAIARGTDGAAPSVMVGRHVDEFVREDGRWRFALRRGFIDIGALG